MQQVVALFFSVFIVASSLAGPAPEAQGNPKMVLPVQQSRKDKAYCPIHVIGFMLMSNLISDLITDLIFKLGDSFPVNHTINFGTKLRSYGIV